MDKRKYLFIGARFYCLEQMLNLNLNIVCIAAYKDSFLEKELIKRNINYVTYASKKEALEIINNTSFDILVSNGCPYILPISKLKKNDEKFINIHPSLLPDLRGINPINGAILFDRPQGATCHYMDDGIDTGATIAQVVVTKKVDMPLDLLYQLSFRAEAEAFVKAYNKNFEPIKRKKSLKGTIYYSRKIEDQILTKKDSIDLIIRKVEAFKIEGQYARFIKNNDTYFVKDLKIISTELYKGKYKRNEILLIYGNNVLTKINKQFFLYRLDKVDNLEVGEILF
jgi:methionyl-tRNA formyltransferase